MFYVVVLFPRLFESQIPCSILWTIETNPEGHSLIYRPIECRNLGYFGSYPLGYRGSGLRARKKSPSRLRGWSTTNDFVSVRDSNLPVEGPVRYPPFLQLVTQEWPDQRTTVWSCTEVGYQVAGLCSNNVQHTIPNRFVSKLRIPNLGIEFPDF